MEDDSERGISSSSSSPRRSSRKKTPKKHYSPQHEKNILSPFKSHENLTGDDFSFGPPWTQEELETFLIGYSSYKSNWEKIKETLPNRTVSMIQSLYDVHKRFIELDYSIEFKNIQFHDIHLDHLSSFTKNLKVKNLSENSGSGGSSSGTIILNQPPPTNPGQQRPKNSAKKRAKEDPTSPKRKGAASPRQRFSKSPKHTQNIINTMLMNIPQSSNLKRKQKLVMEQLPPEFVESSITTDSDTPTNIMTSQTSLEQISQPTSPTNFGSSSLQSPLSPNGGSVGDLTTLANVGMLSPDSKKNYEKNKMLPIKLRKKGTHGNPLLKYIQMLNGDQSDTELIEAAQNSGVKIVKILGRKKTRNFCSSEWFYPTIDFGFFEKNEFMECLSSMDDKFKNRRIFKKSELKSLRNEMCKRFGKPRRLSQAFLKQERGKLESYRNFAREYYQRFKQLFQTSQSDSNQSFVPPPVVMEYPLTVELSFVERLPSPFKKNEQVLVLNPETQHVQLAAIIDDMPVSKTDYKVKFLYSKEERIVQDTEIMQLGTVSVLPVQKRILESSLQLPQTPNRFSHHLRASNIHLMDGIPETPPRKSLTNTSFFSADNLNNSMLSASSQHSPFFSHNNHSLFQSPQGTHDLLMDQQTSSALTLQTPTKKQKVDGLLSPNNIFASPIEQAPNDFQSASISSPQYYSNNMNMMAGNTSMNGLNSGMNDLNNATPETIRSIAKCMVLLRKKQELVKSFKHMNDKARLLLLESTQIMIDGSVSIFDKRFCIDYTKTVLELKNINIELEGLLPKMRMCCSTPLYATTNYPINNIFSQSIARQATIITQKQNNRQIMCQDIFELNREHAKEIVNAVSGQIHKQFPSMLEGSSKLSSSPFSQSISQSFTGKIGDCIALLLHMRSCSMNFEVLENRDVDLIIDAGLMALQENSPSDHNNAQADIVGYLKDHFLKQNQQ